MTNVLNVRYELRRVTPMEWVIVDRTLSEHDPRRTVACVYEVDELEFDVVWLRDLGLPEHFMSPEEALDAIVRATAPAPRRRPSARPVPIPHLPPLGHRKPA